MATRNAATRKSDRAPSSGRRVTRRKSSSPGGSSIKVGDVIDGRWRVLRKLGEGGMGSVWEVRHVINGWHAAMKVALPTVGASAFARGMFEREGKLANIIDEATHASNGIDDSGAVEVYDTAMLPDGSPYMVMEFLEGSDLSDLAQTGKLTENEVLRIVDRTLHVLESANKNHIVHRDIKPENIFVKKKTGGVRLLDYGLASQYGSEDVGANSVIGTPGYMAPEQILGGSRYATAETDIYGVGATAYRMLSGYSPYAPDNVDQRIVACPTPPLRSVAPNVPEHVAAVVDKALACAPSERYSSAKAMRDDLELALQEQQFKQAGWF